MDPLELILKYKDRLWNIWTPVCPSTIDPSSM